jgi:VIT1/CCC1 family predicted Fe2+/Mn2+ transporter
MGKEMVMAIIIAFVAAGTIGIILGLISKASKSKR